MKPLCKRCLLKELSGDEYFASVYEYIQTLPPDQKVEDTVYENRLSHCKQCDNLVNGMCSFCGCFVEVRAAKKNSHCPKVEPAW